MPLSFMTDTVTVIRPGSMTSRGSTVPDWGNATSHAVTDVQVTPVSTVQDRDGRVVNVSDRYRLRCRFEADAMQAVVDSAGQRIADEAGEWFRYYPKMGNFTAMGFVSSTGPTGAIEEQQDHQLSKAVHR